MKNSIIFLITEFLVRGIPFLLLPLYITLLSQSEFGKFSLYISLLPLLSILYDLSQRISIKRFYFDYPLQIKSFILYIWLFVLISFVINVLIIHFFSIQIVDDSSNFIILIVIMLYALIEQFLTYLQISKQAITYNIIYLIRNAIPYLAFLFLLYIATTKSYVDLIYSQMLIFILIVLYIAKVLLNANTIALMIRNLKKYLTYSLSIAIPVLPVVASAYILSVSDRYMIKYFYSFNEVAIYSLAYNIVMIVQLFVMAIGKVWQPFIFENLKNKNFNKIKEYAIYYILSVFIISLLIWLLDKYLVLFLANNTYLDALKLIPILLVGIFFFFLYAMLSNVVFFYKKMFLFGLPAMISAVVNVILNYLLLPKYGYQIAALTTTVSYFIEFVIIAIIILYLNKQIQQGIIK